MIQRYGAPCALASPPAVATTPLAMLAVEGLLLLGIPFLVRLVTFGELPPLELDLTAASRLFAEGSEWLSWASVLAVATTPLAMLAAEVPLLFGKPGL